MGLLLKQMYSGCMPASLVAVFGFFFVHGYCLLMRLYRSRVCRFACRLSSSADHTRMFLHHLDDAKVGIDLQVIQTSSDATNRGHHGSFVDEALIVLIYDTCLNYLRQLELSCCLLAQLKLRCHNVVYLSRCRQSSSLETAYFHAVRDICPLIE